MTRADQTWMAEQDAKRRPWQEQPAATVKAFMSDSGARAAHMNGAAALSEAQAILAETEPQTRYSSTFAPVCYYKPQSTRSERGQMHAALAESLAAFVADDEPLIPMAAPPDACEVCGTDCNDDYCIAPRVPVAQPSGLDFFALMLLGGTKGA